MASDDRTLDSKATLVGEAPGDEAAPVRSTDSDLDDSLVRAVAAAPPIPLPPGELTVGTIIDGTFEIVGTLGAGAMGVVYEAIDLELDRRIAIKVHAFTDARRSGRMWREAKAMAQLSHPNVIAVHEVGRFEDRVFIAMELVDGGSVREWMGPQHPWRDVVEVFVQAARGLAAAHERGLIHRDFKPDNMLIGSDGRVRVADFGLARAAGSIGSQDSLSSVSQENPFKDMYASGSLDARLTKTGTAVGTPAYMAPEQVSGIDVDARADQFAFCVALHEALYGVRPFRGDSIQAVLTSAALGEIRPPPSDRSVPGWLRAVVLRGLSPDPAARYPDMNALVAALQDDPSRRWRRVVLGAGVVATLAVAAWIGRSTVTSPCARAGEVVNETYDASVGESVEAKLREVDPILGAGAAQRVAPLLSDYAQSLADAREQACVSNERGEQSDAMFDQRVGCLDQAQTRLRATVDVLSRDADLDTVHNAVDLVVALPSVDACEDVASLSTIMPMPDDPERAAAIEAVQAEAATVQALQAAGQVQEVERRIQPMVLRGLALDYPPLSRLVLALAAQQHIDRGDSTLAADTFALAYRHAIEGGEPDKAARIATSLAGAVGNRPARFAEASRWLHAARGATLAHDGSPSQIAAVDAVEAKILFFGDRFAQAAAVSERGLASLRTQPVTPRTRSLELHLLELQALSLGELASYEAALVALDDALAIADSLYGAEHPRLAAILGNAARIASRSGEHTRSLAMVRRAANISAAAFGRDSLKYADMLMQVALAESRAGREEEAVVLQEQAIEIATKAEGDSVPLRAMVASNLSASLGKLGHEQRALKYAHEAVGLAERGFGEDSLKAAQAKLNYAAALQRDGDDAEAIGYLVEGRKAIVAAQGKGHPFVVVTDLNLALGYVNLERYADAHAALDRAEAAAQSLEVERDLFLARVWSTRASVLDHEDRDDEARRAGARALERYAGIGQRSVEYAGALLHQGQRTDDRDEAIRVLSLAIEIADARKITGSKPIVARWLLASALGRGHERYVALREEAAERFEVARELPDSPAVADEIRAFLEQRG